MQNGIHMSLQVLFICQKHTHMTTNWYTHILVDKVLEEYTFRQLQDLDNMISRSHLLVRFQLVIVYRVGTNNFRKTFQHQISIHHVMSKPDLNQLENFHQRQNILIKNNAEIVQVLINIILVIVKLSLNLNAH